MKRAGERAGRLLLYVGVSSTITIPLAILGSVPSGRGSIGVGGSAAIPFVVIVLFVSMTIDGTVLSALYRWTGTRPKAVALLSAYLVFSRLWLGLQLVPKPGYDFRRMGSVVALIWAGCLFLVAIPCIAAAFRPDGEGTGET